MRRIPRPTPSMVVASLALAVALSGTAVAASVALAPNSVGTPQLKNGAVTTAKVKNNTITTAKVPNGALLAADFKAGQIPAGPAGPAGAAGAAGPAGPSDAFARSVPGPVAIPGGLTTVASLAIPQAGKYVISAKAYVSGAVAASAICRLAADTDIDNSLGNGIQFTLTNLVVHEFAAAGAVDYQCSTGGTQSASQIKIVAIRVGNLTAG